MRSLTAAAVGIAAAMSAIPYPKDHSVKPPQISTSQHLPAIPDTPAIVNYEPAINHAVSSTRQSFKAVSPEISKPVTFHSQKLPSAIIQAGGAGTKHQKFEKKDARMPYSPKGRRQFESDRVTVESPTKVSANIRDAVASLIPHLHYYENGGQNFLTPNGLDMLSALTGEEITEETHRAIQTLL